jgi:isoquinoline 1-oxidoreductase beta subunit
MGRFKTIARRTFLVGSVAVAGGVAFGAWQVAKNPANPLSPEKGATLNPWLIIDGDGITIIVPRAEMGQGVQTTLAALVAEELDIELTQVKVDHGPPAQAYFNGAMSGGREYENSMEPPSSGWGTFMAQAVPKVMSMQITGGSTSTIDAFNKLRVAGASARQTLLQAAANKLGLTVQQLTTENGVVIAPNNSRISYADLAEDAALLEPPQKPQLKTPSQWRYLGKSQPRLDQVPKATGTAIYGIDVRVPDMLFATIRMSPRFGAGIDTIDTSEAEKMTGVEKVVIWENGFGVIASNTWLAFRAAEAVEVEWGPTTYPTDTQAVFRSIEAGFEDKPNVALQDQGDVEAVLKGDDVIDLEYRAPFLAHATMEPMNATAFYTKDHLELWVGNQAPILIRDFCADAVGLDKDQVTLNTTLMGGGFGRRSMVDFAVPAARLAKEMPGRAVQVTWSREEDMRHDWYRPGAVCRYRAKLKSGRIEALYGRMSSPSPLAPVIRMSTGINMSPTDPTITEGSHDQPYAIENFKIVGYAPDVGIPVGFWRSVGGSQNGFFHESMIDELAYAANADPLNFRLNHIRSKHLPATKVLEEVGQMSNWTNKTPAGVGRGVAHVWSFGTSVAQVIEVRDEDGLIRITDIWIAADLGLVLDPVNVEAQMIGGAIFGLSAAMHGEITFSGGEVEQGNFPDYDGLRMLNTPRFEVSLLQNNIRMGGAGEPGTPPAAPALANALFDLTGKRARELPLSSMFNFVT